MTRPPPRAQPPVDIQELYQRYAGMVYRRIRRFYPEQEAEEVVQEVFERVMGSIDTWSGTSDVASWLYAVTTRHCLNRLRDHRRRRELLDEEGPTLAWGRPMVTDDPEARVFLGELWRQLDDELALIGTLYYVDGMTQAQIDRELGVTGRTVSNRLAALRDAATDAAGGDP